MRPGAQLLSEPNTKKGRLQRACLDVLREHEADGALPTSIRFVFYELVQRGIISKRDSGRPDRDVTDAIMHLRRRELVPWAWIVDETRQLHDWQYAATIAEYLVDAAEYARIDVWAGTPPPLILTESRTFGGILARTLGQTYLCPIAPTNGMVGGFLYTDVAPVLVDNDRVVLYVGDLDLSGGQIEANTKRVLVQEAERELDWRRLALTQEQVEEHGLEPIAKIDKRYNDKRPHLTVEVEALGQTEVTEIVRAGLDVLLPEPLGDVLVREQQQRTAARRFLAKAPQP